MTSADDHTELSIPGINGNLKDGNEERKMMTGREIGPKKGRKVEGNETKQRAMG